MSKLTRWLDRRWGDGPSMDGLKSSIKGTGRFIADVAPYAAFVPGLNALSPLALGAIAAGGDLIGGRSLGESALSGGTAYLGGKVAGAGNPATGASAPAASGFATTGSGFADAARAGVEKYATSAVPTATTAAKAGGQSALRTTLSRLTSDAGLSAIGQGAMGVAQMQENAASRRLSEKRFALEEEEYRRRRAEEDERNQALAPIRQSLMEQIQRMMGQQQVRA